MIRIETYSDRYYLDVIKLVEDFHNEAVGEYTGLFDPNVLIENIVKLKDGNCHNAFLLITEDSCQGIIAGIECNSLTSKSKMFQELIWYVNKPFRRYGVKLLQEAERRLKLNGIDIMIMAVLENSKTEKLKSLYSRLGYKPMETHYVRNL